MYAIAVHAIGGKEVILREKGFVEKDIPSPWANRPADDLVAEAVCADTADPNRACCKASFG
jgi:hypothetical protein